MTTGATGQLGLALPVQGELSGTWGDTVNNGITQYTNIAIAGTLTLTGDGAVTLANTTGDASASNITSTLAGAGTVTAQFAIVRVSGTTTTKVVTGPSYSKTYVVDNASSFAVTFKASGQTGVSIAAAEKVTVVFNGTDYIKLAGTIANAAGSNTQIQFNNGGLFGASANLTWDGTTLSSTQVNITGQGTLRLQDTTGGEYVGLRSPSALGASYTLTFPADDGTSGQALITDGSGVLSWSTAASGDVYGPASSTDNAVARFDSTTGKLLQNSVVLIGDTGAVTGVTDLTASGSVTLSGGTANGVAYLNGSKVVTSGSALTFDGTRLTSTTGKFGGGAASNSASLMVNNATNTATGIQLFQDGIESWIMGMPANSAGLAWSASGSEQMRLTSTGLGIGTSSPAVKLESAGSSNGATLELLRINNTGSGANTAGQIVFRAAGTNYADIIGGYGASSARLSFNVAAGGYQSWAVAGSDKLTLDSSGNLGLGVTPSAWGSGYTALQIKNAGIMSSGQSTWFYNNGYFNGTNNIYSSTGTATRYVQSSGAHNWDIAPSGTAGNAITFTQAMTLDASGNLGIGTSSPVAKLDVYQATAGSNAARLAHVNGNGIYINPSYNYYDAYNHIFRSLSGTTTYATIDNSGNLGLGVTPSADWASSGYKAAVVRSAFLAGGSGVGVAVLGNNAYNDGGGWRYVATGVASYYVQNAGAHSWSYAPSGTAGNAITFTQAMTLTAGGNLGLGTTSPNSYGSTYTVFTVNNASDGAVLDLNIAGTRTATLFATSSEARLAAVTSIPLTFYTNNTERARIDSSGNLLVAKTSSGLFTQGLQLSADSIARFSKSGNACMELARLDGDGAVAYFYRVSGSAVGSISVTASATAYNTSSDYRLKNTIAPMTGALAKVALLKPCTYKWNADGSDGEGFIAHELAEVVPQCVTGEKDAVDEDGNPKYQGIDTSFLVATLTAAIQELKAEFDAYKASHP